MNINDVILDGSAEFTLKESATSSDINDISTQLRNKFPLNGGQLTGSTILRNTNDSKLTISGGTAGNTTSANLSLFGKDESTYSGYFFLSSSDGTNIKELIGRPDGSLSWRGHDLACAAIVEKSLNINGYIKYASGLIMQWGRCPIEETDTTVTFPIAFSTIMSISAQPYNNDKGCYIYSTSLSGFKIASPETSAKMWFAIGY